MNLELFIARRMLRGKSRGAVSVPIVRLAVGGIALGVCVMLLSVFIITGFKQEIAAKLSGFMAHLNITGYETDVAHAGEGILFPDSLLQQLSTLEEVKQAYPYVLKPAILKSETEIHGVVLKGVDSLYNADFYKGYLKDGGFPVFSSLRPSDDILLSASVAALLDVKAGDRIKAYFVQQPPRVRVFTVKGIYDTGFKEYDDMTVLCDIRHLQRLNGWDAGQLTGVAIELEDIRLIPAVEEALDHVLAWNEDQDFYKITSLQEAAPQIFDWLALLNMNVWVILILIVTVAGFNMVSGLLILILDKTTLIGILKALGYKNVSLRKLFLYISAGLIIKGMLWGNVLAFVLAGIQAIFRVIHLDPVTYYMDTVPINFSLGYVILLNVGVIVITVLMLIVPTMLISKISPVKAIKFE